LDISTSLFTSLDGHDKIKSFVEIAQEINDTGPKFVLCQMYRKTSFTLNFVFNSAKQVAKLKTSHWSN
jgi:hypothetical protein